MNKATLALLGIGFALAACGGELPLDQRTAALDQVEATQVSAFEAERPAEYSSASVPVATEVGELHVSVVFDNARDYKLHADQVLSSLGQQLGRMKFARKNLAGQIVQGSFEELDQAPSTMCGNTVGRAFGSHQGVKYAVRAQVEATSYAGEVEAGDCPSTFWRGETCDPIVCWVEIWGWGGGWRIGTCKLSRAGGCFCSNLGPRIYTHPLDL